MADVGSGILMIFSFFNVFWMLFDNDKNYFKYKKCHVAMKNIMHDDQMCLIPKLLD